MQPLSKKNPSYQGTAHNHTVNSTHSDIDYLDLLLKLLSKWKWIMLSLLLALLLGYVYIRYTIPKYGSKITIMVKNDRKGAGSELEAFNDITLLTGGRNDVENEILILKSRNLSKNVVKSLDLDLSYFVEGRLINVEEYKHLPFQVIFTTDTRNTLRASFYIKPISDKEFSFFLPNQEGKHRVEKFSEEFETSFGTIAIYSNNNTTKYIGREVLVNKETVDFSAAKFNSRLSVDPVGRKSNALDISITDHIPQRAKDFLNALVQNYIDDAANEKNYIAKSTQDFIERRLALISGELDTLERDQEIFKRSKHLTNLSSDAGLNLNTSSQYEKAVVDNSTELQILKFMLEDVLKSKSYEDIIPQNILPGSSGTSEKISQYNTLVYDRNKLLESVNTNHPDILNFENQLSNLKSSIGDDLKNQIAALQISQQTLKRQESIFRGKVSEVPTIERQYRVIDRQQNIKESLYLYLRQKQEETAISMAVTSPKAKIIDDATVYGPISPNKKMIYLACFVLGLAIPIVIILLFEFLNNKIHTKSDLGSINHIPFAGELPEAKEIGELINSESRTVTAEAIRVLQTNLSFIVPNSSQAKTIFVTSTMPKEGKTYTAVNLAIAESLLGKKVLLIGLDLRNPTITDYLSLKSLKGITNYVTSDDDSIQNYIQKSELYTNLNVLLSGTIPPNPTEILNTSKMKEMFQELKGTYDCIIVDTAPVGLVSDTLIVGQNADAVIYVVRANYLSKRILEVPRGMYDENKLPNLSILLNRTQMKNSNYGYGYGYGYTKK